jgi:hypothetical protein
LSLLGSFTFEIGTISENFQALGKVLKEIVLLKIYAIGEMISGRISFMNFRGIKSRPTALDLTSLTEWPFSHHSMKQWEK